MLMDHLLLVGGVVSLMTSVCLLRVISFDLCMSIPKWSKMYSLKGTTTAIGTLGVVVVPLPSVLLLFVSVLAILAILLVMYESAMSIQSDGKCRGSNSWLRLTRPFLVVAVDVDVAAVGVDVVDGGSVSCA